MFVASEFMGAISILAIRHAAGGSLWQYQCSDIIHIMETKPMMEIRLTSGDYKGRYIGLPVASGWGTIV